MFKLKCSRKRGLISLPNDRSKLKKSEYNKINVTEKKNFCFGKGRKHCGKRRKCWLPAFSPFPTMFSKAFFLRVVKSQDGVVKG